MTENMPTDITYMEERIFDTIAVLLYQTLRDPTDKFIVAMHYELGYSFSDIADALQISPSAITQRKQKIEGILKNQYSKRLS